MNSPSRYFLVFSVLVILRFPVSAQTLTLTQTPAEPGSHRPKIGVTLSGGGAKGLAHIGILKAIDSAGLKGEAGTRASMAAIFGALYAAGYSADSLEKITRAIDWGALLSNQTNLASLKMEEKDEYGKY